MPESALPKMPGQRTREVAPKTAPGLLPVGYFHIVFSVPHRLIPLMWKKEESCSHSCSRLPVPRLWKWLPIHSSRRRNRGPLYPAYLGTDLNRHPHIHCVVPVEVVPGSHSLDLVSSSFFLRSRSSAVSFVTKFVED